MDATSLKKFDFIFQHLCQSGGGWQNDILYVTSFHLYEPGSYLALKETKKTPTTLLTSMIRTVITHFEGFVFLNYLNSYNLVIILAISLSSHTEIWHVEKQLVFLKGKLQWALVPAPSGNNLIDQDLLGSYWAGIPIPIPSEKSLGGRRQVWHPAATREREGKWSTGAGAHSLLLP